MQYRTIRAQRLYNLDPLLSLLQYFLREYFMRIGKYPRSAIFTNQSVVTVECIDAAYISYAVCAKCNNYHIRKVLNILSMKVICYY